jgi:hypothetical protein
MAREDQATGNAYMAFGEQSGNNFRITALTGVGPILWTNNYGYITSATYISAN